MIVKKLYIESILLKKLIYEIKLKNWSLDLFIKTEIKLIKEKSPYYIEVKIDSTNVQLINKLECVGYQFKEFRFNRFFHNDQRYITAFHIFPYNVDFVNNEEEFDNVIQLAEKNIFEDRFSVCSDFNKKTALQRNKKLLIKSFIEDKEFLVKFYNQQTNEILGFYSGKYIDRSSIELFLYSISDKLDKNKFTLYLENLLFAFMYEKGYINFYAVSSAYNLLELNTIISESAFRLESSIVILGKKIQYDKIS